MDIEVALDKTGGFGRWQILTFILLGMAVMVPNASQSLAIVYIGYKPPHRCRIPYNSTMNESIPMEGNKFSSCKMFVNYTLGNETTDCLHGWEYLGDDGPTIVTKWDLVCHKEVLSQMSQTAMVCGIMLGAVVFTVVSDNYGRKPVFLFSQVMMIIIGVITPFVEHLYVFFFFRFLTGMLQQGILLPGFILMYEMFATKYRTFVGVMSENFWVLATCLYPLLAYLLSSWVSLQVFISLLGLLFVAPLFRYLPESVTWLYANNKLDKAVEIIKKAQKFNKIQVPKDNVVLSPSIVSNEKVFSRRKSKQSTNYTCLDFLRSKLLFLHLAICSVLWIAVTLIYYGLTLSTAQLDGNRYWNAFFNGLVEFPANIVTYFLLQRFGRKGPMVGFWMLTGVFLIISSFIPVGSESGLDLSMLKVAFTMVGKFGVTCSFTILVMYESELFPTNLRVQAVGICSLFGRIGNFLASFSSYIMEKHSFITLLTLGIFSLISGFLVLLLPETQNQPLPETIEDLEKIAPKLTIRNISCRR